MSDSGTGMGTGRALAHGLVPMSGRSTGERHRATSPLELIFDLTFVVAFSAASAELAHAVAFGHLWSGTVAFVFAMFATIWAWINFTWFASAYDTDDWLFRVTTMVQMVGVLILAMGIPALFASIEKGAHLDNRVMVGGYVVMRVAMIAQWLRAALQDTERRATCLQYVKFISAAQIGWVGLIYLETSLWMTFVCMVPLYALELGGPWLAERHKGGSPWHPHHIAERYAAMAIIALGECLLGTIAALSAVVGEHGWSVQVAVVGLAGTALAFTLWWVYFSVPSGEALEADRAKGFRWGYGHMVIFAAIAATGAGLHVVAYLIEGEGQVDGVGATLAVALPVAVFGLTLGTLYGWMLPGARRVAVASVGSMVAVLAVAVLVALAGAPVEVTLVIVMLALVPAIVIDEMAGARLRRRLLGAGS